MYGNMYVCHVTKVINRVCHMVDVVYSVCDVLLARFCRSPCVGSRYRSAYDDIKDHLTELNVI